ncbi:chemotaxis protein CheD [Sporolactobacillus spathodeae]|uniref:Probable chemoreceptor glutamine deamidase CheD n=1 Tax=Sporolactobacillus spathodeae TaxID=1465502 RepID=A0ABS2Q5K4_9BACL|nr:chemotaxis protein CheD [Sporolactobacillus spathodeae]
MIHVGLSEIKYAEAPEILKSMGLGSCVGVVIYHESMHIAGMAHVMLPDSTLAHAQSFLPGKFADTAVPELVASLTRRGVSLHELKAKMAGGAEMFKSTRVLALDSIGKRNAEAVRSQLSHFHIPVVAEETGKDFGRTIEFLTGTCQLVIRAISQGERVI